MNIIIDADQVEAFKTKYTVLTLDTIRVLPEDQLVTAYCVIENIPIAELPALEDKRNKHEELIVNYRRKNWDFCTLSIDLLRGSFGGEVDSFYDDLQSRVDKYKEQDPGEDWNGIIEKRIIS